MMCVNTVVSSLQLQMNMTLDINQPHIIDIYLFKYGLPRPNDWKFKTELHPFVLSKTIYPTVFIPELYDTGMSHQITATWTLKWIDNRIA